MWRRGRVWPGAESLTDSDNALLDNNELLDEDYSTARRQYTPSRGSSKDPEGSVVSVDGSVSWREAMKNKRSASASPRTARRKFYEDYSLFDVFRPSRKLPTIQPSPSVEQTRPTKYGRTGRSSSNQFAGLSGEYKQLGNHSNDMSSDLSDSDLTLSDVTGGGGHMTLSDVTRGGGHMTLSDFTGGGGHMTLSDISGGGHSNVGMVDPSEYIGIHQATCSGGHSLKKTDLSSQAKSTSYIDEQSLGESFSESEPSERAVQNLVDPNQYMIGGESHAKDDEVFVDQRNEIYKSSAKQERVEGARSVVSSETDYGMMCAANGASLEPNTNYCRSSLRTKKLTFPKFASLPFFHRKKDQAAPLSIGQSKPDKDSLSRSSKAGVNEKQSEGGWGLNQKGIRTREPATRAASSCSMTEFQKKSISTLNDEKMAENDRKKNDSDTFKNGTFPPNKVLSSDNPRTDTRLRWLKRPGGGGASYFGGGASNVSASVNEIASTGFSTKSAVSIADRALSKSAPQTMSTSVNRGSSTSKDVSSGVTSVNQPTRSTNRTSAMAKIIDPLRRLRGQSPRPKDVTSPAWGAPAVRSSVPSWASRGAGRSSVLSMSHSISLSTDLMTQNVNNEEFEAQAKHKDAATTCASAAATAVGGAKKKKKSFFRY